MTISIMITTKNRAEDLQSTCRMLGKLNPPPFEILITADGCTDNTIAMVKTELPSAKLIVNSIGQGSVASRNRMIHEAQGDLVFSLDDDSYPEMGDCLAHIPDFFKQNPKLAVVHFPQRTDEYPETLKQREFGSAQLTRSFPNSGAVLKRSIYLQLPGFNPRFFHAYEEPDYALQCVAAGYEICYNPTLTIRHHYTSRARSEIRTHHRHSRNEFWSVLLRCPFPHCLALGVYRAISQLRYACKRGTGWVIREPMWWWQALLGVCGCLHERQPIPWSRYKAWLRLP